MSRPVAAEDICNMSLDYLKQSPLNSISTPVTPTEKIFARWYDIKRQAALRVHPWKFATKRVVLTPNPATPPPFGYLYAYDLPNDYIRKVTVGDDYLGDLKLDIEIENGQILTPSGSTAAFPNNSNGNDPTDTQSLFLRYVYDCQVVAQWDALFCQFFALGMAIDLSPKFSVSAALGRDLKETFLGYDTEARAVNGQDRPPKRIQYSRILTKRRGLPGGIYANKYTVFES